VSHFSLTALQYKSLKDTVYMAKEEREREKKRKRRERKRTRKRRRGGKRTKAREKEREREREKERERERDIFALDIDFRFLTSTYNTFKKSNVILSHNLQVTRINIKRIRANQKKSHNLFASSSFPDKQEVRLKQNRRISGHYRSGCVVRGKEKAKRSHRAYSSFLSSFLSFSSIRGASYLDPLSVIEPFLLLKAEREDGKRRYGMANEIVRSLSLASVS